MNEINMKNYDKNIYNKKDNELNAVALSYKPTDEDGAPVVLASGKGNIAERILTEALSNDIPIHKDPDLVEILSATELGEEIPIEAFVVVSEILRYIYKANGAKPPIAATSKSPPELRK